MSADKSYQMTPIGNEVARYLRTKRMRLTGREGPADPNPPNDVLDRPRTPHPEHQGQARALPHVRPPTGRARRRGRAPRATNEQPRSTRLVVPLARKSRRRAERNDQRRADAQGRPLRYVPNVPLKAASPLPEEPALRTTRIVPTVTLDIYQKVSICGASLIFSGDGGVWLRQIVD